RQRLWIIVLGCLGFPASVAAEPAEGFAPPTAEDYEVGGPAGEFAFSEVRPKLLRFEIDQPGLLTVAALGGGDRDLKLVVADAIGQELPEGWIDQDPVNAPGGEYTAVGLDQAGTYYLVLTTWGGAARSTLTTSFMPAAGLVAPDDPQSSPLEALPLSVGMPREAVADPDADDVRDWFVITPSRDGLLRVQGAAKGGSGADLMLEAFEAGKFWLPIADGESVGEDRSEQELMLAVTEGGPVYVRVTCWGVEKPGPYVLTARWME
ncbi:MAG: hypothetical protein AAGL98_11100, partial [Planctomycetota bacterium]